MRKLIGLFLLIPSLAIAQQAPNAALTTDKSQTTVVSAFACEGTSCAGLTVDATAGGVALTASKYNPTVTDTPSMISRAQTAICTNSGAKIWVTSVATGVTLASGKGQPIADGGLFTIYGYANISNFKAIRDAAISSTLFCDYYRQP